MKDKGYKEESSSDGPPAKGAATKSRPSKASKKSARKGAKGAPTAKGAGGASEDNSTAKEKDNGKFSEFPYSETYLPVHVTLHAMCACSSCLSGLRRH